MDKMWFGSLETTSTQPEEGAQKCGIHLAKLGRSPSEPALHTLKFPTKWISVPLHPAATDADDFNSIRQPLRKNKLHSWSVQRPQHGHWMFPNSGIKEFHLNALKHLFFLKSHLPNHQWNHSDSRIILPANHLHFTKHRIQTTAENMKTPTSSSKFLFNFTTEKLFKNT